MTDSSPSRYTQSLLLALLVHVGILLLLVSSPAFSPPEVDNTSNIQAVMMAHVAHTAQKTPTTTVAPTTPASVVHPQASPHHTTPPPPIHGEAGVVQHITPPAPVPQRPEVTASQVQGPRSPDRVPAIKRPRPSHIDQHQADQELKDIDQEASQLDAQQKTAAIKAAQAVQDAQVQSEANRLAQQQQAQLQANLINAYRNRIIALIKQHWTQPLCADPSMSVLLRLQLLPDGTVVNVTSIKPNSCLDLSVRNAIDSVARLPVPEDPVLFEHYFRSTTLRFRPLDND
ncbi:MAG: cell envelope integrity protein TolA [Pseudomonadales bacterium]|nr:cell envelope integrity protein TolA [Pseudomonadales bacterium]